MAIPELLDLLFVEGCTVTIDAAGRQTAIAGKIREKGADYVLAVKGNQGSLSLRWMSFLHDGSKFIGMAFDALRLYDIPFIIFMLPVLFRDCVNRRNSLVWAELSANDARFAYRDLIQSGLFKPGNLKNKNTTLFLNSADKKSDFSLGHLILCGDCVS